MSLDIINIAVCLLVYFALIKGFKNVPEFVKLTLCGNKNDVFSNIKKSEKGLSSIPRLRKLWKVIRMFDGRGQKRCESKAVQPREPAGSSEGSGKKFWESR
jgi:hypothetical protein